MKTASPTPHWALPSTALAAALALVLSACGGGGGGGSVTVGTTATHTPTSTPTSTPTPTNTPTPSNTATPTSSPTPQPATVLYSFGTNNPNDGIGPQAALVSDGSGNFYGTTYEGGGLNNLGTVFSFNPTTNTETVLHAFGSIAADGSHPVSGLVSDGAGNFYGSTYDGGINHLGTLYQITAGGAAYFLLYNFGGISQDGQYPSGDLLLMGNILYGTTLTGGNSNSGLLFRYQISTGVKSNVYNFLNTGTNGQNPQGNLLYNLNSGCFFTTTKSGGAYGYGTVTVADSAANCNAPGGTALVHSFGAASDGQYPQSGLVTYAGLLYGNTHAGGAYGYGTIFKISTSGGGYSSLYSFQGGGDGSSPVAALWSDGAGNFYGTTPLGGAYNKGTAFKITTGGVHTVLYSFGAYAGDGQYPMAALVSDGAGNLYGTTQQGGSQGYGTIFKIPQQ